MKKKTLVYFLPLALFLTFSFTIYFSFIKRTKGFCVKKIISSHPYYSLWDIGPPTPEQITLLDHLSTQSFYLFGSGAQCYAFVSEDGDYVIKFFKQKHMCVKSLVDLLPLPFPLKSMRNEKINRRLFLRKKSFSNFRFAYENFQEETGLLFLHLNPTKYLKKKILFYDLHGKSFRLDLDKMEFVIQKRVELLLPKIKHLMTKGKTEKAKTLITSILDHLEKRSIQGIGDNDSNCKNNLGVLKKNIITLDVGQLYPMPPRPITNEEYLFATKDLQKWLDQSYPDLGIFLRTQLQMRKK